MNKNTIWFVPAGVVALGILALSTFLAAPIQIKGVSYLDKIEHCFAYFVLVVSFMWAFQKANKLTPKISFYIFVATSLYGLGLEVIQFIFFYNRFFEWLDAFANLVGVVLGFISFRIIYRG